MLRTSIHTTAALALTLFTPACDDMTELEAGEVEAGEGEAGPAEGSGSTRFGCFPMPCSNPPLGNTNWIGSNPLDTVTQDSWNVATRLSNGNFVRFTGAWCPTSASPWKFNATAKGELVFWKASTGGTTDSNKVRGTAVEGCKFYAQFSDTESFASSSNVMIKISDAVAVLRADNVTTGFKYLMTVANLNKDLPAYYEDLFPTCYDNDDAPGNYYLTVRPGLMLNTDGWQMMADSSKQSWVCAAGAFGHFAQERRCRGHRQRNGRHDRGPGVGSVSSRRDPYVYRQPGQDPPRDDRGLRPRPGCLRPEHEELVPRGSVG